MLMVAISGVAVSYSEATVFPMQYFAVELVELPALSFEVCECDSTPSHTWSDRHVCNL